MIKTEGLTYRIGNKEILHNISLRCEPGKVHAIAGPNGAGKSTLFQLLGQELSPSEGKVFFDNIEATPNQLAPLAKCRGVLPQQVELPFPLRVWEVVMMGRYPHSSNPTPQDEQVVEEVLEAFELLPFIERNYLTLSGGERQRVQFARVFAQIWDVHDKPRYLLLDEPLSFLDIRHQLDFFREIQKFLTPETTVLVILHDLNHVLLHCDEVHVIHEGQLVATGEPKKVITPELLHSVFNFKGHLAEIDGQFVLITDRAI